MRRVEGENENWISDAEGKWMDKREERKDRRVGNGDMQENGNGKTIRGLQWSGVE